MYTPTPASRLPEISRLPILLIVLHTSHCAYDHDHGEDGGYAKFGLTRHLSTKNLELRIAYGPHRRPQRYSYAASKRYLRPLRSCDGVLEAGRPGPSPGGI